MGGIFFTAMLLHLLYLIAYFFKKRERTVSMYFANLTIWVLVVLDDYIFPASAYVGYEFWSMVFFPFLLERIIYKGLNCDVLKNSKIKKIIIIVGGIAEILTIIYFVAFFNGYRIF